MSDLAVVVVTFNSADVIGGLLDSIGGGLRGVENHRVILVDNASSDDTLAIARRHPSNPQILETGRNAGYAAAINSAVRTLGPEEHLLVLNPDVRLLPRAGTRLLAAAKRDGVAIAAPKQLTDEGSTATSLRREPSLVNAWSDALFGSWLSSRLHIGEVISGQKRYRTGGRFDWATGAALLIAPRARRLVGEWDESYFLYSEEVDYFRRTRESGLEIIYVPEAEVTHIGGDYHTNDFLSGLMTANRIKYFRRYNGPVRSEIFRLSIIIGALMRIVPIPSYRAVLNAAVFPARYPPVAPTRR